MHGSCQHQTASMPSPQLIFPRVTRGRSTESQELTRACPLCFPLASPVLYFSQFRQKRAICPQHLPSWSPNNWVLSRVFPCQAPEGAAGGISSTFQPVSSKDSLSPLAPHGLQPVGIQDATRRTQPKLAHPHNTQILEFFSISLVISN